ncbi:MAG TPA: hypothetical protein VMA83_10355 [Solirubrobacteraceae bacterium]|nr:hypothetical protein [Solirubrobacteraceae bacterium]
MDSVTTATVVRCEWCGAPATVRDLTPNVATGEPRGDATCEPCARFRWGYRYAEAVSIREALEHALENAQRAGVMAEEIREAVDRWLKGGEATVGAELAFYHARMNLDSDSAGWTLQFAPHGDVLDGGA